MRVLAALGLVLLLAGCVPAPDPVVEPTAEPSSTPVFVSEEEALAAAEEAYAAYQAAVDASLRPSDIDLSNVAVGRALELAEESASDSAANGLRLTGDTSVKVLDLVRPGGVVTGDLLDPTQIYACLDVSATDVLNAQDESTVQPGRPLKYLTLVSLLWSDDGQRLLVSEVDFRDAENACS